jgi:hypothetical protein
MPTFYVNKSGNDANGGTSHADAFATIQKAIDTVASGDTIIVGSGTYSENLIQKESYTLQADGDVKMIGTGTFITFGGSSNLCDYVGIEVRGYTDVFSGANARTAQFTDCICDGGDFSFNGRSGLTNLVAFDGCLITNCEINFSQNATDNVTIEDSTFDNVTWSLQSTSSPYNFNMKNCDFEDDISPTGTGTSNFTIVTLNFCNVRGAVDYQGTTYANLAAFQAAFPSVAPNSINQTPFFNNDYTLNPLPSNPNIGTGESGVNIGAFDVATEYEGSDVLFDGAILTDVIRNDSGDLELNVSGSGTIVTVVLDFLEDITINKVRLTAQETYPTDVVDTDNTDVEPNRHNFEYRFQTDAQGSFGQTDGTPAYTTAEWKDDINITCRYFQMRITLRSDGVAA